MQRKWLRRGFTVLQNSLNNLLLPAFNIGISALVVRLHSRELWGEFVSIMVIVQFGVHLVSWGNKEYLLREFSRHPNQIPQHWQTSLVSRALLFLILCATLIFSGYDWQRVALCVIWGAGLAVAQSFEVIILYRRAFGIAFVVEIIGIAASALFVVIRASALNVDELLLMFTLVTALEAAAYFAYFTDLMRQFRWQFDFAYFSAALPFFLLGFSGLLASRIDLYSVSYFLDERAVGEYQIFINLMLYIQSLSVFIVGPYAKSVYRLNDNAIYKISLRLFGLGMMLVIPGLIGAYGLFTLVYHVQYGLDFMLLGGLFVLPIFAYLPLVYRLYKLNQTGLVLKLNLAGAGVNLLLNTLLLPNIGSIGAVLASAVVQWGMLVVYLVEAKGEVVRAVPTVSHAD